MLKFATFGFLFIAAFAAAQQDSEPKAEHPLFTSDLIVWSSLQTPVPIPQVTERERSFSGTVARRSDEYLLQVSSSDSYRLDRPELISLYEGHQISVIGNLDESGTQIRIHQIEEVK